MKVAIIASSAETLERWCESNGYGRARGIIHVSDALSLESALEETFAVAVIFRSFRSMANEDVLAIMDIVSMHGVDLTVLPLVIEEGAEPRILRQNLTRERAR